MTKKTYSINYLNILCLILITLKLCKVIDWNWLWILCPLWGQIAISIIVFLALKVSEFLSEGKLYRDNILLSGASIHWDYKTNQMYDDNGNIIDEEDYSE